jgi:protein-disulfide isomerase
MKIATLVVCAGLLAASAAIACGQAAQAEKPQAARPSAPRPAASSGPAGAAAKVGSEVISEQELEAVVGSRLLTVRTEEYELRRAALEELIGDKLLKAEAGRRGVSVEALVKMEIDDKAPGPSEAEVNRILEANRNRLGAMSEADAKKSIAAQLTQRAKGMRREALVKELSVKSPVQILIEPPRLDAAFDPKAPARGPKDAVVTIVEFSDFQCPYCSRSNQTMHQLMQQYPTQVKWVFRDYPLPIHNEAIPAAEAARCAAEQGKFWEMHDHLFQNQRDLTPPALARYGAELKLDTAKFNACTTSGKHKDAIQKDMAAGNEFGVSGTPAFFINGRFLNGARPIEAFTTIIDEELQFAGVKVEKTADR